MKKARREKGFLLISAIILIVIGGLLAATVAYIAIINSRSMGTQLDSARAYYLAESGLRRASYEMFENEQACVELTGLASLTNVSLGDGQFNVTSTSYIPTPAAVLTSAITAIVSVIPLSSLTGYAPIGRVIIKKEAMNYGSTSSDSSACNGSPPCLIHVTRGMGNTIAVSHSIGLPVTQLQCDVTSTAGVPNLTSPLAKRSITESFAFVEGWAMGGSFSTETILGRQGNTWARMGGSTGYAGVPDVSYNDLFINSVIDVWAVGDNTGGTATIIYWDGLTWSAVKTSAIPNKNLRAVTCVPNDPNDCWAVGDDATFAHYQGISWVNSIPNANVPTNKKINDISCPASNDCWGVGDAEGGDPLIVHWNGTQWSRDTTLPPSLPAKNLNSIICNSATDCWAVGQQSSFFHYNGSAWAEGATAANPVSARIPSTIEFNAVTCVLEDPDDCWAVGGQSGGEAFFARLIDNVWTRVTAIDEDMPNHSLKGISCANANDCWVVGSSRTIGRWNGSVWSGVDPDISVPNVTLNAIALGSGNYGRILMQR